VAPAGQGGDDDAAPTTPFSTVQAAILHAFNTAGAPKRVCVATGPTCSDQAIYSGSFAMRDGVSVLGGYSFAGGTMTRCPNPDAVHTELRPADASGVSFGPEVLSPTQLDGLAIQMTNLDASGRTAGITVNGARNVLISNVAVYGENTSVTSRGVDIVGGADVTIVRSSIFAGEGTTEAIGVRVSGSRVTLRENCSTFDPTSRRCLTACDDADSGRGLRASTFGAAETTYAVHLEDSPGSIIERNAICGGAGQFAAGILVVGDAAGDLIRANHISTSGALQSASAVELVDCAGTAPWIVDNEAILATALGTLGAGSETIGLESRGDCRPVIERNADITGASEGTPQSAIGLRCRDGATGPSACAVLQNVISGGGTGQVASVIGLACSGRSCARVGGNLIRGARSPAGDVRGLTLGSTGAIVAANDVMGGCGSVLAMGADLFDSRARLENNVIRAGACSSMASGASHYGMSVNTLTPLRQVDVHSNLIDGGGLGPCFGDTLKVKGLGQAGAYRNNIFAGTGCDEGVIVAEEDAVSDPRVFVHNDLNGAELRVRYLDEGMTARTVPELNGLTDMETEQNIDAAPMTTADGHLMSGSMCIDAGTDTGAPAFDMDGQPRPRGGGYDIGPDEL
jgi:hypothetical protein